MQADTLDTHKLLPYLAIFRQVVELGSFQAVATQHGVPRSSISKKITQLEAMVDQRLLQRTTRKLSITESGEHLLKLSASLTPLLEDVASFVSEGKSEPSGKVKISSSTIFGQRCLVPHMPHLIRKFPQIHFDLSFSDSNVDLIEEKIDIAIRIGHLPDSPMLARQIAEKRWCFVASPSYIAQYGTPKHPKDLLAHQCLVFRSKTFHADEWAYLDHDGEMGIVTVEEVVSSDDARALVDMLKAGLGVGRIDASAIRAELDSGELQIILPEFAHPQTAPIQLLCLGKATRSKACKAVWEELASLFCSELPSS